MNSPFSLSTKVRLAKGLMLHSNPLYVQFYITARCNLTCQQCNIIFANSDVRECTLDEIERIAENLARIGTAIVLLTGGEPFVRRDLPEIIRAFVQRGIHVRMQTNGLAREADLARCVEYGARDISISLDSLQPALQDRINGEFPESWSRAIDTIAMVTRHLPSAGSFAALGCVLCRHNIEDIEDVVRFGTAIGWFTSLVPVHIADRRKPMNFRTYDQSLAFLPEHYGRVDRLIDRLKKMKADGHLLYDSEEYLEDVKRFVRNEPIRWRRKNQDVCDSPELYFAILPNGAFAVCCDHRLPGAEAAVYSPEFPDLYHSRVFKQRAHEVAAACPGCMFGSYPEITISARYWEAMRERLQVFFARPVRRSWPIDSRELHAMAKEILNQRAQVAESV